MSLFESQLERIIDDCKREILKGDVPLIASFNLSSFDYMGGYLSGLQDAKRLFESLKED